jgi:putative FmdB family regulatory protein
MPIYEYQCESCGNRFEVIQRFSDEPVETCGKCGGPVHRLLSAPAIQFKGSGWYITDYARKGNGEPAKASQADSSGNGAGPKSAESGESKKEAKKETSKEASKPAASESK